MGTNDVFGEAVVQFFQLGIVQEGAVALQGLLVLAHSGAGLPLGGIGRTELLGSLLQEGVEQGPGEVLLLQDLVGEVVEVVAKIMGKHRREVEVGPLPGIHPVGGGFQAVGEIFQRFQIGALGGFQTKRDAADGQAQVRLQTHERVPNSPPGMRGQGFQWGGSRDVGHQAIAYS